MRRHVAVCVFEEGQGDVSIDLRTACVAQYKMNDNESTSVVLDSQGFSNGTMKRLPYSEDIVNANTSVVHSDDGINGSFLLNEDIENPFVDKFFIETNNSFASLFGSSYTICWREKTVWWPCSVGSVQNIYATAAINFSHLYLSMGYNDGTDHIFQLANDETQIFNEWAFYVVSVEQITPTSVRVMEYQNNVCIINQVVEDFVLADWASIFLLGPLTLPIGCLRDANEGVSEWFHGNLDGIKFFNRVLSPDEIAFLYNNGDGTEELTGITEPEGIFDYE